MLVLLAIGCWVFVIAAILLFDTRSTRRRKQALERAARNLGFEFEATGKPFAGSDVHGLTILKDDPSTTVTDILRGQYGGCSAMVFDVACCDEFAVNAVLTTCAAFRSVTDRLPSFQVSTKDVFERVRALIATQSDIGEGDHEFAKHFSVHCANEVEARKLFTPARLAQLRLHADGFRIESSADWILIYRPGAKVSANKLATFVNTTSSLATVLLPEHSSFMPAA